MRDLQDGRNAARESRRDPGTILVIKNVPADICANCGEEYVNAETSEFFLGIAEESVRSGVQISVSDYAAA